MSFAVSAPLNRYSHELYSWLENFLQKFESNRRHSDDEPVHLGNSHIVVMGMGRVGTGAYDLLAERSERIIGLDSDPGKVEQHRSHGRRVLYADAEDPGFWSRLELGGIHTVMLAMPDLSGKLFAIRQLRKIGFKGTITTTALFDDEVAPLEQAGADFIYNYYNSVGAIYAQNALDKVNTPKI